MSKSNLDPHADLILDLLAKEATNGEILDILLAKPAETSLEAVRAWIKKNADPKLLKGRGKGRRRKPEHARFSIIPDHRDPMTIPPVLEATLNLFSEPRTSRIGGRVGTAEAFLHSAGIEVDPSTPPWRWILPARSLTSLADVELLLLAYLLSDRPELPARGTTAAHRSWLLDLTRDASKLRAKINEGINFTFSEIP
ncbi:MAG: hypothetical protein Q8Q59_09290 [Luteolibacter sp.]|jgi:hypothetical protein|nr:hypothetical protein [Luteolibacter sp.]